MLGVVIGMPRMRLKSVKPLLPPKPVSLRKNSSIAAKVSACVMIEKYTPLMRERKAKKPNTKASRPGTSTHQQHLRDEAVAQRPVPGEFLPVQEDHEVGQVRLRYWPSRPIWRIRYMPMP